MCYNGRIKRKESSNVKKYSSRFFRVLLLLALLLSAFPNVPLTENRPSPQGRRIRSPDRYTAYRADAAGSLADYTALAPILCTGTVTAYEMATGRWTPSKP